MDHNRNKTGAILDLSWIGTCQRFLKILSKCSFVIY